jgi:hypothetical protein
MKIALCVGIVLFMLASSALGSSSLYMNVQEGGRKCFLEDVPKDTLVLVKYTSTQRSAGDDPYNQQQRQEQKGWIVTVDGPSNEFIARRELGDEGRYAFTAQVGGEHKICLQTNTGKWFAQGAEFVCPPPQISDQPLIFLGVAKHALMVDSFFTRRICKLTLRREWALRTMPKWPASSH